ncbi:MAG: response regulator [Gammaproteobacteria bacterium]|nr:response regulator [Gammaproteobacteria bacterium]
MENVNWGSSEEQAKVASERLRLLFLQSAPATVLSLINGLLVTWLLWHQLSSLVVSLWLACIGMASLIRVLLFAKYAYSGTQAHQHQTWQLSYTISLVLNAAVWGVGCYLLVQGLAVEYQIAVYFSLLGMSAGALAVYSSIRWLVLVTICLLLFPMTTAFFVSGNPLQVIMAVGCSIFMLFVFYSSESLSEGVRNSLFLALQLRKEQNKSKAGRIKAEQAVVARGEFVSSISHEIRTPLMAILGLTELLKEHKQSAQAKELVDAIGESGNQLASLVNNVLDFSKIDKGELELQARPFSLRQMLIAIESIFIESAKAKGLSIELHTDEVDNDFWYGDEQRIRQIIINIVGNALKYTEQGEISIEAQVKSRNGGIVIAVTDSGVGISADKLDYVFEAYSQVQAEQSGVLSSTGLGLSIAQKLTRAMGGEILLASKVGHGSRFQVSLPLAPCSEVTYLAQREPEANRQIALDDAHILIAEDSSLTQKLIAMFLQQSGAVLTFVGNGEQAIAAIEKNNYDVVIMDVQMPVVDGMQALQGMHAWQIKQGRPLVPVILQTADNRIETKKRAMAIGAVGFLAKPYNKRALLGAVATALKQSNLQLEFSDNTEVEELAVLQDEFLAAVKQQAEAAAAALQQHDMAAVRQHAHNIKGYAGLFQRQRLFHIAYALEESCGEEGNVAMALAHVADVNDWLSHQ